MTTHIPYALHRNSGQMLDVTEVARGKACECVCPSCGLPMLARQGEERDWHFAHMTSDTSGQDATVCEYSAYVSIRMMAHQLLREMSSMRVPAAPGETDLEHRRIDLGSREIAVHFDDVAVDAVCLIEGAPLVLYFTHPSRDVPAELYELDGDRVGALRIDLQGLLRFYEQDSARRDGMRLDRSALRSWLESGVESKTWIYHPRQKRLIAAAPPREQQRPRPEPPHPLSEPDNRPLMARYSCATCAEHWVGGFDDPDMAVCLKCRGTEHVERLPIPRV